MIIGPLVVLKLPLELLHGIGSVCLLVIYLRWLYGIRKIHFPRVSYYNSEDISS